MRSHNSRKNGNNGRHISIGKQNNKKARRMARFFGEIDHEQPKSQQTKSF